MAAAVSAGLLLHRGGSSRLEVLLAHPGGPFWARRDEGAWSIPKGERDGGEELLATARREFAEETGAAAPDAAYSSLGSVRQRGGKTVHAWAVAADVDATALVSNPVEIEWPPRSGRRRQIPEVDRFGWFDLDTARRKINVGQLPLLDRLEQLLAGDP